MNRMIKTISCIVLGVMVCIALSETYGKAAFSDITSDVIKKNESQINEAQQEKKELNANLTNVQAIKAELEKEKNNLNNYVKKLDESLGSIAEKIQELMDLIEKKEAEIKQTTDELKIAEEIVKKQYESMKTRIQFMYEKGDNVNFELMFTAESFGDMLNKADYIEMFYAYDRNMLKEFRETQAEIERFKKELEEQQNMLEEAKKAQEAEQNAMEELIGEKENEILKTEGNIKDKEAAIADYQAEIAAQDNAIKALEAAIAAERKRIAEANGKLSKYDGGKFAWPAPSYTRISSDYGSRLHPTLGIEKFHNGVDMAAPSGSPILAGYNGTVISAAYNSTMGNYIMIDHGDSIYTVYMHASALYVGEGATVTRGQKIAAVGSTGRSTGPHLHFSVRKNGAYVSPWSYIS